MEKLHFLSILELEWGKNLKDVYEHVHVNWKLMSGFLIEIKSDLTDLTVGISFVKYALFSKN